MIKANEYINFAAYTGRDFARLLRISIIMGKLRSDWMFLPMLACGDEIDRHLVGMVACSAAG